MTIHPSPQELPLETRKPSRMYVARWQDGTAIAFASRECAEEASQHAMNPAERIDTYRWIKPSLIALNCPRCDLPWGECSEYWDAN